jgi:hypothetical protein
MSKLFKTCFAQNSSFCSKLWLGLLTETTETRPLHIYIDLLNSLLHSPSHSVCEVVDYIIFAGKHDGLTNVSGRLEGGTGKRKRKAASTVILCIHRAVVFYSTRKFASQS